VAGAIPMAVSTTWGPTATTGLVRPTVIPTRGTTTSTATTVSYTATTTIVETVIPFVVFKTQNMEVLFIRTSSIFLMDWEKKLLQDLFRAYYDTRKNKRNTFNALAFEVDLESNLLELHQELLQGTYKIRRSICFINFKPVQREIFAAHFRDRIIHHLLYNYLQPVFEPGFIKDSYSCRIGKGTHYGIQRVQKFTRKCTHNFSRPAFVLKLDILGYFMRMDRNILFEKLLSKINGSHKTYPFDKDLIQKLLQLVIFNDPTENCIIKGKRSDWNGLPPSKSLFHAAAGKGLPIGNLTSQFFGNVYLNSFDHFVREKLEIPLYGRYVDDMVLIHQEKKHLKKALYEIKNYLKNELELEVHPRKIYLQEVSKGFPFLGTYIKPYRIYSGKRLKKNFFQTIHQWNSSLEKRNYQVDQDFLKQFTASINSYLGMMIHYNTYRLRRKMLMQLDHAFFKWIYFSGDFTKVAIRKSALFEYQKVD
jgi:RNA-directed DNA polymerase